MTSTPTKPSPHEVRDEMIRRETGWLRSMGLEPNRAQLDREVAEKLERAAARRRDQAWAALVKRQQKLRRAAGGPAELEAKQKGYRYRKADVAPPPPPKPKFVSACACGGCIQCRREARMREIMRRGLTGDEALHLLAWEIVMIGMRAKAGTSEFSDVAAGLDRARVVTREVEDICDRSVPLMGAWRP